MMLEYQRVHITLRTLGHQGLTKVDAEKAIKAAGEAMAEYERDEKDYVSRGFLASLARLRTRLNLSTHS